MGRDTRSRSRSPYRSRDRERDRHRGHRSHRHHHRSDDRDRDSSTEREKARRRAQRDFLTKSAHQAGNTSNMFWDGFQWIPKIGTQDSAQHNATRKNRRLYVANLPIQLGLTEEFLGQQLFAALRERGCIASDGHSPVLHVWFAREKGGNYGFVEFATLEDTENALALDGLVVMGAPITIRRPSDYQDSTVPMLNDSVVAAAAAAAANSAVGNLGGQATSRIVRFAQIVRVGPNTTKDEYTDVIEDMKGGCGDFGKLDAVYIASADVHDPSTQGLVLAAGDVCLEYSDLGGAEACMNGMKGRKYDGQVVHMSSVDEETWQNLAKPVLVEMDAALGIL
ncbi:splicing factor u2af large subunit, putative [Perkinsus marinus ATCC 50983]|uniref:Splicing factor u2af large subunit, putative n=1 Tax=Perkinsus marinus (strain ATCC 50983 / TXsc) TaxID=423536 RepID=C5K6H8_PERM5|nr:splicing factor u2af large subunit, putative [Perkinsus marinus ATCC 50983]EER19898.1 splicing factor u2af large subunit, putative [Perkinsus marinus ATCC 50983]|eukprot:XP_002788102.1 splicing factor u2af large subunit, putative [Perkinsus marinus ATCC 50983]